MLPVLGVPCTFRGPSTESVGVLTAKILRVLRRPEYCKYWQGPNTAVRVLSIDTTRYEQYRTPRLQANMYPQYRTPKYLEYSWQHAVQNLEILRALAVHITEILSVREVLELAPAKVICSNSHSWDYLWVFSAKQWAWTVNTVHRWFKYT